MNEIMAYLDELFPNPKCELKFNKDYELLIAVMLSAQTTDKAVNKVTDVLFKRYPSLNALRGADTKDIEEIIKPIGTFRKKASNIKEIVDRLINECNGVVANNRKFLESLSGVGRKTTNVVLSNLFDEPYMAVDTHVSRVSVRLGLCKDEDSVLEIEKKLIKKIPKDRVGKMHHQLVLFGRYYCKARNPLCSDCKLKNKCSYYV